MKSEILCKSRVCFLFMLASSIGALNSRVVAQQPGNITIFADPAASTCFVEDAGPGTITLFVLHTNFSEMLSSSFRVVESAGFHAIYVSETVSTSVHGGDFRSGIFLGYGECQNGSLLLGKLTYATLGTSEACAYLDVVAGEIYPWPEAQSCLFEAYPAPPLGKLYVNPDGQCQVWCSVPTQASTWGKVKAMYR